MSKNNQGYGAGFITGLITSAVIAGSFALYGSLLSPGKGKNLASIAHRLADRPFTQMTQETIDSLLNDHHLTVFSWNYPIDAFYGRAETHHAYTDESGKEYKFTHYKRERPWLFFAENFGKKEEEFCVMESENIRFFDDKCDGFADRFSITSDLYFEEFEVSIGRLPFNTQNRVRGRYERMVEKIYRGILIQENQ